MVPTANNNYDLIELLNQQIEISIVLFFPRHEFLVQANNNCKAIVIYAQHAI